MSAYHHRRTADPLARLTPEEREAATLIRLASSVGAACDVWLAKRGLTARPFNQDAAQSITTNKNKHQ